MTHPEAELARAVALYLQLQYPRVIYRFDLAADMKLSMGQARRNKALHPVRGFPDLMILEPRGDKHGLALELKALGARVYKQDGTLVAEPHIHEQAAMLARLREKGYAAQFVIGWQEAQSAIDGYLKS